MPSKALLLPCIDPLIPGGTTDNDVAVTLINYDQSYRDCKQRQADLAKWVNGQ